MANCKCDISHVIHCKCGNCHALLNVSPAILYDASSTLPANENSQVSCVHWPAYTLLRYTSDDVYDVGSGKQGGSVYAVNMATAMCTCFEGSRFLWQML